MDNARFLELTQATVDDVPVFKLIAAVVIAIMYYNTVSMTLV
jgi:hypothetical protein